MWKKENSTNLNSFLKEWLHWLIVDIPNGEIIRDGIEKMKFAPSKMEK